MVNYFSFFVELIFSVFMLLSVNQCIIWRLYVAYFHCLQHLEIFSEM